MNLKPIFADAKSPGKPNHLPLAAAIISALLVLAFAPRAPATDPSIQRARAFLAAEGYQGILLSAPSAHPERCKGVGALADFTAQGFETRASGTVCDTPTHETSTIALDPTPPPTPSY